MNWSKVRLIFLREVRDQLRDRRTLFMIFILPIVLYPALGLGLVQMSLQFGKQTRSVGVDGAGDLPAEPPLLSADGKTFHPDLFHVRDPSVLAVEVRDDLQREDVAQGRYDVVLKIPPGAAERLARGEQVQLQIYYDGANDRSELARALVRDLLSNWADKIVAQRLREAGKPETFAQPVTLDDGAGVDVSTAGRRTGAAWGRIFPFLLVMMALTGAFYPAIDLCAGEKERGTMETLLISPARRGEIVLGKFLTIFLFSTATTVVNLASMGLTFGQIASMIPATATQAAGLLSPPSPTSVVWMLVLMLPLAAFFSALCMALAVFARSTKEGQYYLMPLFLVVTPLIFLTLAPGVELNPFYSLVPVANVALLLKTLMLNQYDLAAVYFLPVLAPTLLYGFLALRFAADQFNREDVLFREAERFNLREWLVRQVRYKRPTTTFGQAWAFFAIYMMLRWYLQGRFTTTPANVALQQVLTILAPAVFLAFLLTKRPLRSLHLGPPAAVPTAAAALLAFAIHPVAVALAAALQQAMPFKNPQELEELLRPLVDAPLWARLLVVAGVAPFCEEVAFRGFLLCGFLKRYRPPLAILVSSVLFGVSHMIPQQMIAATLLGIVLGVVATRAGSIWPAILLHAIHNGMLVLLSGGRAADATIQYDPILVLMGGLASVVLLAVLLRLPSRLRRAPGTLAMGAV